MSIFTTLTSRRHFLTQCQGVLASSLVTNQVLASQSPQKTWKIAVHMDTAIRSLGHHGLHAAFFGLPNVEIVGLFDPNPKDIEKRMGFVSAKRHYTDYAKMLKEESPDIVVLTQREGKYHIEEIRMAAEHGCHVYCEKPLTTNLEEADEIIRISEEKKIKIAMAHPCRNGLGFVTMKKLIQNGKIGTPLTIQGWGKSDHRGGGEDMMTLGTHIFDLMVGMFGAPEEVMGDVRSEGKPFAGPYLNKTVEDVGPAAGDEIFATFRFKDAIRGVFESRRNTYTSKNNRMGISVIGSEGMLSYRFADADREPQPLRFSNAPSAPASRSVYEEIPLKEERIIPGAEPIDFTRPGLPTGPIFLEAGRYAAWDLMRCIEEDRQPIANLQEARMALEMIYGVYASHLARTPIALPLKDRRHPLRDFKMPS